MFRNNLALVCNPFGANRQSAVARESHPGRVCDNIRRFHCAERAQLLDSARIVARICGPRVGVKNLGICVSQR